jgi:hypothetical protein
MTGRMNWQKDIIQIDINQNDI